jgi:hypothetical protein
MFTLQHTGQAVDDVKEHHVGSECGGQSTNSLLEEELLQMN